MFYNIGYLSEFKQNENVIIDPLKTLPG